jgi:hypothetical protein
MATEDFLTRKQAAAYLRSNGCPIDHRRLAKMAIHNNSGKGPPFLRSGWRTIVYSKEELEAWRLKRVVRVA